MRPPAPQPVPPTDRSVAPGTGQSPSHVELDPSDDLALHHHLERVGAYMRDCALLPFPRQRSPLREELAAFLVREGVELMDGWVVLIGTAFAIPQAQWPGICTDMRAALVRWAQHIEDPENVDTYRFLRAHARRGFISHFPPSRFLCAQMKLRQLLAAALAQVYRDRPALLADLRALLEQEFQERMLHITDFFVDAREEELREQEASYRKSIDNAPAAILFIDVDDGTVFDANRFAERATGFAREALLGRPLWDLHPPEERERAVRLCEDAKATGTATCESLALRTQRGDTVPIFANAGLAEYGHHRFLLVIYVDVSDRRRLESQLIQSEKMAAIGQLAAGIAHEIRNPLGIIMNALYDLGEIVDTANPDVREDLQIATEEMARVQAIINNLLEFSRASTVERERVDINDLLRKTLQLMNKYLQNNDVRVTADLDSIPPCVANQNALRQIFLNLITNAVQAMPHGGELRLRTALLPGDRIQLAVSDTGVGIPPEHLTDIFNPFFTTKAPGQGTGLGLSVVHSVVKRYGGDIHVRSQVSAGTTFTIELPCTCTDGEGGTALGE